MNFADLVGKIIVDIKGAVGDEELRFCTSDGKNYRMWHQRDCCEGVNIEDICGDLQDLVGSPIVRAEETSNNDMQPWQKPGDYAESFTWTFYKIDTAKGGVTIRWYGSSNGYYSELVDFAEVE